MRVNSPEGRSWIWERASPHYKEEVVSWVWRLIDNGFCFLVRAVNSDRDKGIHEENMESLIDILNRLTGLARRHEDSMGWAQGQLQRLVDIMRSDPSLGFPEPIIDAGLCKKVEEKLVKLAGEMAERHLFPARPEDLVIYAGFREIARLCETLGHCVPQGVSLVLGDLDDQFSLMGLR